MKLIFCFGILLLCVRVEAQVINIEQVRMSSDSLGLHGDVKLQLSIQKTTKSFVSISNGGHLTYFMLRQSVLLFGNYSLAKGEGENFTNNGSIHLRYNRSLSNRIELELFSQSQFNSLTKIDHRFLNGVGLRFQLTDYDNARFYWGIAYMNELEKLSGNSQDLFANRFSSYFSFSLLPQDDVSFSSTTYVQPRFGMLSDYRVLNDNELSLDITDRLSLSINFQIFYDTETPSSVPNLTYDLSNGLNYKFGN